jgi:hypothetical protein
MIEQFCKEIGITIDQFYGREVINHDLDLNYHKTIPDGFNPIVNGYIWLSLLTKIPKGFNPIVGKGLYLNSLKTIPEWFDPVVGGNLSLGLVTKLPDGFNPVVCGTLYCKTDTFNYDIWCDNNDTIRLDRGYLIVGKIFGKILEEKDKYYKIRQLDGEELYICYQGNEYGIGNYLPDAIIELKNKLNI